MATLHWSDHRLWLPEKWIYTLRRMPELFDIPRELAEEPYVRAFGVAEKAALTETERYYYGRRMYRRASGRTRGGETSDCARDVATWNRTVASGRGDGLANRGCDGVGSEAVNPPPCPSSVHAVYERGRVGAGVRVNLPQDLQLRRRSFRVHPKQSPQPRLTIRLAMIAVEIIPRLGVASARAIQ